MTKIELVRWLGYGNYTFKFTYHVGAFWGYPPELILLSLLKYLTEHGDYSFTSEITMEL